MSGVMRKPKFFAPPKVHLDSPSLFRHESNGVVHKQS